MNTSSNNLTPREIHTSVGKSTSPYILFNLGINLYGINTKNITIIQDVPEITETTAKIDGIRGISHYKNEVINVLDLRSIFGMPSLHDEIFKIVNIDRHIADHADTIELLKKAIDEGQPPKITGDSNNCSFGKWINQYRTKNEEIQKIIENIHVIHKDLHKNAEFIGGLIKANRKDIAMNIFQQKIGDITKSFCEQLYEMKEMLENSFNETMIIIDTGSKKIGLIVDSVETVESITEIQPIPKNVMSTKFITHLGIRESDREIILLVNSSAFA